MEFKICLMGAMFLADARRASIIFLRLKAMSILRRTKTILYKSEYVRKLLPSICNEMFLFILPLAALVTDDNEVK